ncbi:hypothetical protein [Shewanella sediminis]|uniref:hypothetical protein n=1 Tax=Shewanella sediminis TaxID=271097 RepID=UPI0002F75FE7|nr:hypothetical protein [Shewanella sediminis]
MMTEYALSLIDYLELHYGDGQLLAELYADENFSPDWRDRVEQPLAFDSGFSVTEGDDDDH